MALALSRPDFDLFVPDHSEPALALERTTHLGVGAHADDLEILAAHGIVECFGRADAWFTGVVVTDGAGSARAPADGEADPDAARLKATRRREQREAASLGEYGAQLQLAHPSADVKSGSDAVVRDLEVVLRATRPGVVYTHALSDRHPSHVAVTLALIAACRRLEPGSRPGRVLGAEVWGDLDWLAEADKVRLPLSEREELQAALLGVFASQIGPGKRYDLATLGRRRAHATFSDSHALDRHAGLAYAMDLTPLVDGGDPATFLRALVQRFEAEALSRVTAVRRD